MNFREYIIPKGEKETSVGYNGDVKSIFDSLINTGITERTNRSFCILNGTGKLRDLQDFVIYFEPMEENQWNKRRRKAPRYREKEGNCEDTEQKETRTKTLNRCKAQVKRAAGPGIQENTSEKTPREIPASIEL